MATYSAYGLSIRSDISLPELRRVHAPGDPDLVIRLADLPAPPAFPEEATRYARCGSDQVYLAWKDLGAFTVREGSEILCDPEPGSSKREFRLPLLGIVLGVLLHQRDMPTFHGSAASIDGQAVAFLGRKGCGKSTMAAALQRRGHPLLADDVLAVRLGPQARDTGGRALEPSGEAGGASHVLPTVLSAFPFMKLWPESAHALGYQEADRTSLSRHTTKQGVRISTMAASDQTPLARIYVLEDGETIQSDPLRGGAAFQALLAQSYATRILGSLASTPEFFAQCHAVARQVPVHTLHRPMDFEALDRVTSYVEDDVRTGRV